MYVGRALSADAGRYALPLLSVNSKELEMETRLARISLVALVPSSLPCVSAAVVLACDGPPAGELIQQNRLIVNAYGFVAILLFLATVAIYFFRGRTGILAILISLIIGFFHPFWHYGGRRRRP